MCAFHNYIVMQDKYKNHENIRNILCCTGNYHRHFDMAR